MGKFGLFLQFSNLLWHPISNQIMVKANCTLKIKSNYGQITDDYKIFLVVN